MSSFLIVNTRTGGQNSNILGAKSVQGNFIPYMEIPDNGNIPSDLLCQWSAVSIVSGLFGLQISDKNGVPYYLAINPAISGTACVLVPCNSPNLNTYNYLWAVPYPGQGRIILMYPQSKEKALALDAGNGANPIVWDFVSNVNQTWQFGTTLNNLTPNLPL